MIKFGSEMGSENVFTIGEIIRYKQPSIFERIMKLFFIPEIIIKPIITESTKELERIMQERPKPGRGGLMKGESELELW